MERGGQRDCLWRRSGDVLRPGAVPFGSGALAGFFDPCPLAGLLDSCSLASGLDARLRCRSALVRLFPLRLRPTWGRLRCCRARRRPRRRWRPSRPRSRAGACAGCPGVRTRGAGLRGDHVHTRPRSAAEGGGAPGEVVTDRDGVDLRGEPTLPALLRRLLPFSQPQPSLDDEGFPHRYRRGDVVGESPPRPHRVEARVPVGPALPCPVPAPGRRRQPEPGDRHPRRRLPVLHRRRGVSHQGHHRLAHRTHSPVRSPRAFSGA